MFLEVFSVKRLHVGIPTLREAFKVPSNYPSYKSILVVRSKAFAYILEIEWSDKNPDDLYDAI